MAVKAEQGQAGLADWPNALRCRKPEAIAAAKTALAGEYRLLQGCAIFLLHPVERPQVLTQTARASVWWAIFPSMSARIPAICGPTRNCSRPRQMHLTQVAGCPPDAFAADGQLWGNPLYDWPVHKATGFAWWKRRMQHATSIYDVVRIDHFRGFESYYSIPAGNTTAAGGHWEKARTVRLSTPCTRIWAKAASLPRTWAT